MKSQVDRLAALSELSEKLQGRVVFQKKTWVIMDKNKKLLVKGVPQNRWICFVDDTKDRKRVLTYNSKGSINSSGIGYNIMRKKDVQDYIDREYGEEATQREFLEPVEAELTVKLKYQP